MKLNKVTGEEGQAAVFITILLMFALIAFTALAVDGGHLYVVRRDLQNMTDAACLAAATELALGGDETTAIASAQEYVIRNGGDFFSVWSGELDNVGSGSSLTWGIQVVEPEVRVALLRDVPTYFTMIFNRPNAGVGAGSHCNSQAGGGPLPIAVRRYQYVEGHPEQQLDLLANKNCQPQDCYYGNDYETVYLAGYYGLTPFHAITNTDWIPQPGALMDDTTGNIDCDLPPADGTPEGACVLGVWPETNDGTPKFSGYVSLDIRNVTGGCPPDRPESECGIQYYNGATGQDATNKDLASQWFCARGWEGWRVPEIGDQLAFLPGVSANFSTKTMIDCGWKVGDQFVAVVYSGYVWDVPDVDMTIDPTVNEPSAPSPGSTHTFTYTVTLEKPGASKPWDQDANFALDWFFVEPDNAANTITPTVDITTSVPLYQGDTATSFDMTVSVTDPITGTSRYLGAVTLYAREQSLNIKRWASTSLVHGTVGVDYTFYPGARELTVAQGSNLSIPLATRGFGFTAKKAPITAKGVGFAFETFFDASSGQTVWIQDGAERVNERFTLQAREGVVPGYYPIDLEVQPSDAPAHTVRIDLYVYVPTPGGTPTRFVIVEGFAPFQISYIDVNDIVAYAIGPIVPHLEEVTAGTRGALLPW